MYTTDELVTALNAAIETQRGRLSDSLVPRLSQLQRASTLTAFLDQVFLHKAPIWHRMLSDATAEIVSNSANQQRVFRGCQRLDLYFGDDLDLVATMRLSRNNNATIDALLLRVDELESAGLGGTHSLQPRSRASTLCRRRRYHNQR